MAGLWKGLKAKWKDIKGWFKKLPGTVKQSAGLIGDGLKSIFVDEGDGGVDSKKFKLNNGVRRGRATLNRTGKKGDAAAVTQTVMVKIKKKAGESLEKTVGNKVDVTVNRKKGWKDTIAKWLGIDKSQDATVNRKKGTGFTDAIRKFLGLGDGGEDAAVNRTKGTGFGEKIRAFLGISDSGENAKVNRVAGWKSSLAAWLGTNKTHTVKVNRKKGWKGSLASWIGSKISVAVNLVKGTASGLGGWLKSVVNTIFRKAEGGVFSHGSWKPITAYAGGGSPGGGQLFLAREAGPELVGTLGGSTAVMNNKQIVSSVAAGVASAVRDVIVPALMSMDDGPSGDLVVFLGDEEVARSALRGIKKIDKQQHPVIQLQGV